MKIDNKELLDQMRRHAETLAGVPARNDEQQRADDYYRAVRRGQIVSVLWLWGAIFAAIALMMALCAGCRESDSEADAADAVAELTQEVRLLRSEVGALRDEMQAQAIGMLHAGK